MPFGQRLAANFGGSRTAAGYARIFAQAPSQYGDATKADEVNVFSALVAAMQDPATPADIQPHVAAIAKAHAEWLVMRAHEKAASDALAAAVKAIEQAKEVCLDAAATTKSGLELRFPRDKKRVDRYLPPTVKKVVKVVVPA